MRVEYHDRGTGGVAEAARKVMLLKSRPWSTGPSWVPPLIMFVTFPMSARIGSACCHQLSSARLNSSSAPDLASSASASATALC